MFIVAGMGKSGTTLISKMLHKSGIVMIEEHSELDYYSGNHFENHDFNKLNYLSLDCENKHSLNIDPFARVNASTDVVKKAKILINDYQLKYGDKWGFKDPRTTLTFFDLWCPLISQKMIIFTYRDPVEVVNHYTGGRIHRIVNIKVVRNVLKHWIVYNKIGLRMKEIFGEQVCIVNYNQIISEQGILKKLSAAIGLDLVDCRDSGIKRIYSSHSADLIRSIAERTVPSKLNREVNKVLKELSVVCVQ